MGVIIEESGLRFGEYHENQVFQIETSEQYTKSLRQNGIKTCEFILRKGTKLYFFEAKQSCPRQIMKDIPDNEKEEKKKRYDEFIQEIVLKDEMKIWKIQSLVVITPQQAREKHFII